MHAGASRGSPPPSTLRVLFEKFNSIANGQNGFRRIVGNLTPEFFLERHHELNGIEAVGAKVLNEGRILCHLVGLDPKVLHDDFFYPLANVTHLSNLVRFELA
jgi:hypothetical protein